MLAEPAAELPPEAAAAREPAPAPEPPPRGEPLPDAFVEAAWRHLDDLPPREKERLRHRFENGQPELTEYVQIAAGENAAAIDTADELAFENWAMFELARSSPGARTRAVTIKELQAAERAADESAATAEPALDSYVEDALAEAALDDEEPLAPEDAAVVRRIARAVIRTLVAAGARGG